VCVKCIIAPQEPEEGLSSQAHCGEAPCARGSKSKHNKPTKTTGAPSSSRPEGGRLSAEENVAFAPWARRGCFLLLQGQDIALAPRHFIGGQAQPVEVRRRRTSSLQKRGRCHVSESIAVVQSGVAICILGIWPGPLLE